MVAVAAIFLSGCFGSGGSPAPAPNNVHAVAKDSRVIVTWDMAPGVEYWIFHADGSGVTPQNCSTRVLCGTAINASSPAAILSLYDGQPYSFSINGRTGSGPGGPGSVAVDATPRLAGTTWTSDAPPTTGNLLGIAYGAYDAVGSRFVAVGTAGAMYSGTVYTNVDATTGITWSQLTNPLGTTTLNAVSYDTTRGEYVSVGTGGAVIAMIPASSTTWATQTSGTTNDLFAVANSGAYNTTTVATGAGGTIIYSLDGGANWHPAFSIPSGTAAQQLNGVTFGYSTTLGYVFVAVGTSGTLLYSVDYGVNWLAGNCTGTGCTSAELKGVTYGGLDSSGHDVFVAVGASGTVLTSENGVVWTPQTATTIPSSSKLNAVTYSGARRFVAVADDGNIYYSEYGNGAVNWTPVAATVASLNAVATGGLYHFSAVGNGGVNAYAD